LVVFVIYVLISVRRNKIMKTYFRIALLFLGMVLGCTQMIRVDADTYVNNPKQYEGQDTLITAELGELFQGRRVEIAAPIIHF
jgi:hypothetical protein